MQNFLDKITVLLLSLLCFYPLMPFSVTTKLLILFLLWSILVFRNQFKINFKAIGLKPYIEVTVFFIFLCFSLVFTKNLSVGFSEIQKGIPILLLPFVGLYFIPNLIKKYKYVFLKSYILANILYIIYFYCFSLQKLVLYSKFNLEGEFYLHQLYNVITLPFEEIFRYAIVTKHDPFPIFFHKGYNSMFLLFSIVLLSNFIISAYRTKKVLRVVGMSALLFVKIFVLIHWFSLPNLIALFLISGIILYIKKNQVGYVYLTALIVLPFTYNTSYIQEKINNNYGLKKNVRQIETFVMGHFKTNTIKRDAPRVAVYDCSLDLIKKAPILGYGVGDVNDVLSVCYKEKNYLIAYDNNLNSHNYFFHIWLSGGIFTITSLLFFLINCLYRSIKRKQFLFFSLIVILILNFLIENVLFRSYGTIFFSLFITFFYTFYQQYNSTLE